MILDKNLILSELQAVTATAISANVIDLGINGIVPYEAAAAAMNLGAGNEIPFLLMVNEDFAALTSLTVTIETSAAAALTSPTVLYTSGAIPLATLKAGYKLPIRWMPDAPLLRYLGIRYTVTGTNASAGKVSAAVSTEV
jgi:hypothetical protein